MEQIGALHRLNRGGNRDANRALHVLAFGRMNWNERTREYVTRRTAKGKSKREILRCLKRYVAHEVYRILRAPGTLPSSFSVPRHTLEYLSKPAISGVAPQVFVQSHL